MEEIMEETVELVMGILTEVLLHQIKRVFVKLKDNVLKVLHFVHWSLVVILFSYLYMGSTFEIFAGKNSKTQKETENQFSWNNIIPIITLTETAIHFLTFHIIHLLSSKEHHDNIPYKSIVLVALKCQYLYTPFLPLSPAEYANVPWIVQIMPIIDGITAFLFFILSLYSYHTKSREPGEVPRVGGGNSRSIRNVRRNSHGHVHGFRRNKRNNIRGF